MSSPAPELMSNIFSSEPRNGNEAGVFHVGPLPMKVRGDALPFEVPAEPPSRRRTSIWAMHHSVHCWRQRCYGIDHQRFGR
jgi:hypothetical protein